MNPAEESFATSRTASTADLDQLQRLEQLAAGLVRPQRGGELHLLHDARTEPLSDLLAADNAYVTLGCIDGVVVGYCATRVVELTNGETMASISDLFVEPDAREVGAGEAMMNAVLDWATSMRCRGVDATALPGDRQTKNFFESFGLVARAISVHRAITP